MRTKLFEMEMNEAMAAGDNNDLNYNLDDGDEGTAEAQPPAGSALAAVNSLRRLSTTGTSTTAGTGIWY